MARSATKKLVPGKPVRGSRTGRPIMVVLDLLGRRWTLRVLWELRSGPATFRELRERCDDVSPTVLNTRLKELRDAGLVEHSAEGGGKEDEKGGEKGGEMGYRTTASGGALLRALAPLNQWAETWARELS